MIKVAGLNSHKQLVYNLNGKTIDGFPVVCPPKDIQIDVSTLLSISLYDDHTVCILPSGKAIAFGNNDGNRIYNTLPSGNIEREEYEVLDDNEKPCKLLSVVCGYCYTLYMAIPAYEGQGARLIYISQNQNNGKPLFLNIGDNHPIALFGGNTTCASITSDGSVIIINNTIMQSSIPQINAISLPNKEKAISVACCDHSVFVLSDKGHVFKSSSVDFFSSFKIIEELNKIKIVWISGSCRHCLAVSNEGYVYACGSNGYGEIALNDDSKEFENFTLIVSLKNYNIVAAYAGYSHSLFQTKEGLILGCGYNGYDQMMLNEPTYTNNYLPLETSILKGATFCIAGHALSVVFINCEPPQYCPNQKILNGQFSISINEKKEDEETNIINHMRKKIIKLKKKNSILQMKNSELQEEVLELRSKIEALEKMNEQQNQADQKEFKKLIDQNFENGIHITEGGSFIAEMGSYSEDDNSNNNSSNNDDDFNDDDCELINNGIKCGEYHELEVLASDAASELKTLKKLGKGMLSKSSKVSREEFFVLKVINNYKSSVDSSSSSALNDASYDDDICINQSEFDSEKMKLLINLYETLNKLNHPNIVRTINVFSCHSKHHVSILLDFYPNTLKSSVKRLSDIERVGIIYEIGKAMKSAHKLGIIHRDLKPGNVLIDSTKHVKISDFGAEILLPIDAQIRIASQKKNNHYSNRIKYIAPELFSAALNHTNSYDEKVDVFSFGVIVFYILVKGEFPKYVGENPFNDDKLMSSKGINAYSRKLIIKCCATVSADRPSFKEVLNSIKENNFHLIDGIEKKMPALKSHLSI